MITQGQKMCSIARDPFPLHEREYATDVERVITNLHLCSHHLTIVKFLRPVKFIMYLDALSICHLHLFSSFRCWQGLHQKFQIIFHIAIVTHPTQGYSGIVFLTRCSFECRMVFIIVDVVAPLTEPPVKCGQGPDRLAAWINRLRHFSRIFQVLRVPKNIVDKTRLGYPEKPFFY